MNGKYKIVLNPYDQNKLSALITLDNPQAIRFDYRVQGKTAATDFFYSCEEYTVNPDIVVVGLYADAMNTVTLNVYTQNDENESFEIMLSTEDQDYGDIPLNLEVNIIDPLMADSTLGQGWFITSEGNGYDINGDLRLTGLLPWMYGNLKIIDNALWSARASETWDPDKHAFAPRLYRINLAGKIAQTLAAPEGYGFHHDITTDNKGNLFVLGSLLDNWNDQQKLECIIYKFDLASGELLWQRDYSAEFSGAMVLDNTDTNDVHFNSLEYIPQTNQLMVNSRSSCTIIGLNIDTGDLEWIIDNPEFPTLDSNLTWPSSTVLTLPTPTVSMRYLLRRTENIRPGREKIKWLSLCLTTDPARMRKALSWFVISSLTLFLIRRPNWILCLPFWPLI
ncbi:aryl-sulfate sulfotransferase [Enterobacteriaceae bacterium H4N4]|uniref:Aryl-sulfate sulfotransferase n=1 Tax=Silvania confinis TaxID=2926470 RepID=A0A9J6QA31_9ENTR|nr:aryl-sulfate sulfotransferase [Silvania confinis]MCU6667548.1 aryl-sulfate sulfotransferase [Silvania confinis]